MKRVFNWGDRRWTFTFHPFTALWYLGICIIAWKLYGWGAVLLIFAATIELEFNWRGE
jgi:hypothetical protein